MHVVTTCNYLKWQHFRVPVILQLKTAYFTYQINKKVLKIDFCKHYVCKNSRVKIRVVRLQT